MTRWLTGFLIVMASAPALAHDFWLTAMLPATPQDGTTITGDLGERFPVPDERTIADAVRSWRIVGATGDVAHADAFHQRGSSLATTVRLPGPGVYMGVMEVRAAFEMMEGPAFTDYLREEGLDDVITERAVLGHSDVAARERFRRYAKIVIANGDGPADHVTRPVGMKAEFVPTTNPSMLSPGDVLVVRFLVDGVPVPDAQIAAVSAHARVHARTDRDGVASLAIPSAGRWLIRAVHMFRPLEPESPVEWESYWASLAFETRP